MSLLLTCRARLLGLIVSLFHRNSILVNPVAYRIIALDFSLWSLLPPPIQRLHLGHFETILQTSRFRNFNAKFRFVKFGAVKKILYVLQTQMYREEMIPEVVAALSCIARQNFSTDPTIKPVVSYLAANLEVEGESVNPTQSSHFE